MKKQDFLNPKSMLTPGIAGGTVMLITNALISQFNWSGPIVALVLSFLVGALVFLAGPVPLLKRAIYYVLNSLIIFAMATGSASVGNKAEAAVTKPPNTTVAASATPAATSPTRVPVSATPYVTRASRVSRNVTTNRPVVTNAEVVKPINPSEVRISKTVFFKKW